MKILLSTGSTLDLETHRPKGLINRNGDMCGNGSIDWRADGLFLYEIVEKACEKRKIVAAMMNDQYITLERFINNDCSLRLIAADEPEGREMMNSTAKLLVNYAMYQLYSEYESLESESPMLYSFVAPDPVGLSKEKIERLNIKLAAYLSNPPEIKSYLMSYTKAVKQIVKQGSITQAKYLMAQDNLYPLYVHEIDGFIQVGDEKPLISINYIETLRISAQEVLTTIGVPIMQLNVNVT